MRNSKRDSIIPTQKQIVDHRLIKDEQLYDPTLESSTKKRTRKRELEKVNTLQKKKAKLQHETTSDDELLLSKSKCISNLLDEQYKKLYDHTPVHSSKKRAIKRKKDDSDTLHNRKAGQRHERKSQTELVLSKRSNKDVQLYDPTLESSTKKRTRKRELENLNTLQKKKATLQHETTSDDELPLSKRNCIRNLLDEQYKKLYDHTLVHSSKKRAVKIKKDDSDTLHNRKAGQRHERKSQTELVLSKRSNKDTPPLPKIRNEKWNQLKTEITHASAVSISIQKCLDRMQGHLMYELHFTALHYVRKAIVDSLLNRNWDNLAHLLILLIHKYWDPVFLIFIRQLCQILKHYHPGIRGTELEDQIDLIVEKYSNKNHKTNIV